MLRKKYSLSEEGVRNVKIGAVWTIVANLAVMSGMGILFMLAGELVAHYVDGTPLPDPVFYAVALVAFFIVTFVAHWFQYTYTYGVVYRESGKLRIALAERLRKLPLSFFGKRDVADLTETIMTDATTMEHVFSHVLPYLYGSLISTGLVSVGLLAFDWRLALASLWSIPVAFALLFASRRVTLPMQESNRSIRVEMNDSIQEMLDCIREIRAINQEESYLHDLDDTIDLLERRTIKSELIGGIFVCGAQVILRLGIATCILVGSILVMSGDVDFMTMFCFLLVVSRLYAPFDQVLMMAFELFASQVASKRMGRFYGESVAEGTPDFHPDGHDIEFEGVGFRYDDEGPVVLDGVSFAAREGEVTALVGPSGGGKSTCAKLAARFWDPQRGRVTLGGVDISTVDPETLLTDFSVVFQEVLLFDDTVMENIRLGRRGATDEEVLAAARAANCDGFVSRMPDGYLTMIGENGARLSGGERQRISIARALLKDAPVVLLDEATASLDVENESQVQLALTRLLADKTVLVIAHRMRTVANADRIVVLAGGKVAETGSPDELMAAGGIFARMVELQGESAVWRL